MVLYTAKKIIPNTLAQRCERKKGIIKMTPFAICSMEQ